MRAPETSVAPLWHEPTQERSRRRVERILEAARELLCEEEAGQLKMRELAARAGVPVGSLYQFFPDREALLACLLSRHLEGLDGLVQQRFEGVATRGDFIEAADGLLEGMYRALAREPAIARVSIEVQRSPALRALDLDSTRRNARALARVLQSLGGTKVPRARLETACFLICDLWGNAATRALGLPKREGDRLIREYAAMTRAYMLSLFDG